MIVRETQRQRDRDRQTETDYIQVTFIAVYCSNCSTLLFIVISLSVLNL
jgi:hypothetical protein